MLDAIEDDARRERERTGRKPLGAKVIQTMPFDRRTDLPPQPWFEDRKRMTCWAGSRASTRRAIAASPSMPFLKLTDSCITTTFACAGIWIMPGFPPRTATTADSATRASP
jgi:hypothetical protein